jgi:hypothetical protein
MALMPRASTMCGGLMIFTSSPYALCHQSSKGADVSMAPAPQLQKNAPSGPVKPSTRTPSARSAAVPRSVVRKMTAAEARPATTPPR